MRALLGIALFSMVGCDALWSSYIGMGDLGASSDSGTCSAVAGCDMASSELPDADLPDNSTTPTNPATCMTDDVCKVLPNAFCDLNSRTCVAAVPAKPFLEGIAGESMMLSNPYMVMATGDFDGDTVADVAVTGVFPNIATGMMSVNATTAQAVPVEIYLGDGKGGLTRDADCPIPAGQVPVHLLTIPGAKKEILVATKGSNVYRCSKVTGVWVANPVPLGGAGQALSDGFKQLALITNPGPSIDLAVRTSNSLFPDSSTGILEIRRANGAGNFDGLRIFISNSDVTWVAPHRFGAATTDVIATTWDGLAMHPGIEFHTINAGNTDNNLFSGTTGSANVAGGKFAELNNSPYAMVYPFRIGGQASAAILYAYTQNQNSLTVFAGDSLNALATKSQKTMGLPAGIMQAYAGDANGDGQDEIGVYTLAPNKATLQRHLQLWTYSNNAIGSMIYDIPLDGENVRAMALETLGNASDFRQQANRKDLISLIETPGGKSRLLVRRANLNYKSF